MSDQAARIAALEARLEEEVERHRGAVASIRHELIAMRAEIDSTHTLAKELARAAPAPRWER